VNAFRIMLECVPWLALLGFGLNFLLNALVPSWRGKNWNHWQFYSPGHFQPPLLGSFLGQLGFVKRGTIVERQFDERSAVLLNYALAAILLFLGISGLATTIARNMI
jgi:hypothetical protein